MDSHIIHENFVSVNNVIREYNEMNEETKNRENTVDDTVYKQWKRIASLIKKYYEQNSTVRGTKQNTSTILSNRAAFSKKKPRFIKNQTTSRLELR